MLPVTPESSRIASGAPGAAPSGWQRVPAAPAVLTLLLLALTRIPRVRDNPRLFAAFAGAAGLLLAWTLLLAVARRRRGFPILFAPLQKSHWIQSCVQISVYAYWGWYWRPVYDEIPLFVAQLLFLYALDALLSWTRGRPWRVSFGPWPIVLSTNIFLWFQDDWYAWQFVLVATGALGKEFIQWTRDGRRRHVFNPSAFTLAVFSVALLSLGATDLTWARSIATSITEPPYIYLEVFLLGLVVQYFFSVTLVTLCAVGTIVVLNLLWTQITGVYLFIDSNIPVPVFIGLHFLVTDPATSPRSNLGRALFGSLYGALSFTIAGIFGHYGLPTLYDKLLPIPVLNLCVPWIDRVAGAGPLGRFGRWESAFPARRLNLAHMGCWIALFGVMYGTGYIAAPHPGESVRFWKQAVEEGRPGAGRGLATVLAFQVKRDNGDAWNEMGLMYLEGKVVRQDDAEAARCLGRGAQLGNPLACVNLVTLHILLGKPCASADLQIALSQLELACDEGDGKSGYLLGTAYETGRGRPQVPARARALYEQACSHGSEEACARLAKLRARDAAPEAPK